MDPAKKKAMDRTEARRQWFSYLDKRIPELHKEGVAGRDARVQADIEYAKGYR